MKHLMTGRWIVLAGCAIALAGGEGCSAAEDVGGVRQALLCQSVDACDDHDPCTDDVCAAGLCLNLPLLNACGASGDGAGGQAGATSEVGAGGEVTIDAGAGAPNGAGGHDSAGGSNGKAGQDGAGAAQSGGSAGQSAKGGTASTPGSGASANDGAGADRSAGASAGSGTNSATSTTDWQLEGGSCALAPLSMGSGRAALLVVLGMLTGGVLRRTRLRRKGEPGS